MSEKIIKQEITKADNLIETAQRELDSAKKNKAPQGTIKHLEQRVKALESRKKRYEKALSKLSNSDTEGQSKDKKNAAASSGKKAGKKDGD